jgi:glutamate-1-semialdehyde aminotransferase
MSTLNCFEEYDLAEELLKIDKWADMVRFAKTGGEINSIAIRIARAASGKNGIAFCGYHGWHDWYLSANLANQKNLNSHLMNGFFTSGVPKNLKNTSFPFEFNNIKSLKKVLAKNSDIGVIKMEVYRNFPPQIKFLKEIRNICNKKNLVLIFDECTSGFRGNYGGIYKNYNVQPDIVLYGKALGNGYPITACVGRREVMETVNNSFISSTFWSERVGFSAALATLKEMRRIKSWQKVEKVGLILRKGIKKIAKDNNIKINFFGLPAITNQIIDNKNSNLINSFITQEMLKKGFLSTDSIYASVSHNKKNIETYLENLNDVFKVVSQHKDDKNFLKLIEGPLPIKPFNRMN